MKPEVEIAAQKLALELSRRQAKVQVVLLPSINNRKTGLDDFILAKGASAFASLDRYLPEMIEKVIALNQRVVFVQNPPSYLWLDSLTLRSKHELEMLLENEFIKIQRLTPKGPVTVQVKLCGVWCTSPLRATARSLTWMPGMPPGLGDDGAYNTYKPLVVIPKLGESSLLVPYRKMLDRLFEDQVKARDYLEDLIAYRYANPGAKKVPIAVVLIGPEGAGKSKLGESYGKLFMPHYVEILGERLTARFNSLISRKLFVMVSEMMQPDRRQAADAIKGMISQETQTVEQKHVDAYELPDRTTYFITTNHANPVCIDEGDRRFFIVRVCPSMPLGKKAILDPRLMDDFARMLNNPEAVASLADYLLRRAEKLSGFNPFEPPLETDAKRQTIEASHSELRSFCRALRDDPEKLWVDYTRLENAKWVSEPRACDVATSWEVLAAYQTYVAQRSLNTNTGQTSPVAVGNALSEVGVHCFVGVLTTERRENLWCIRNFETWRKKSKPEIAQHYNVNVLGGAELAVIVGGRGRKFKRDGRANGVAQGSKDSGGQ